MRCQCFGMVLVGCFLRQALGLKRLKAPVAPLCASRIMDGILAGRSREHVDHLYTNDTHMQSLFVLVGYAAQLVQLFEKIGFCVKSHGHRLPDGYLRQRHLHWICEVIRGIPRQTSTCLVKFLHWQPVDKRICSQ